MARKRKSRRRNSRVKGQSIKIISVYAFLCFVVTLIFSNYISQYGLLYEALDFRSKYISSKAEVISTLFHSKTTEYVHILKSITKNDTIHQLLLSRKWDQVSSLEKKLLSNFPEGASISLLPRGYDALNEKTQPKISYACLDLVHKAEKSQLPSLYELHGIKTSQAHLDIIYPVMNSATKKVIATIRLTLKADILNQWLKETANDSYIEIIQDAGNKELIEIAKSKNVALRIGSPTAEAKILGTRWQLRIWLVEEATPSILNIFTLIVIICSIIIAGITIYVITFSFSRTIKLDLDTFMQLVTAIATGKKNHEYKLQLKEFKEAALNVKNLSNEAPMGRERDDDSEDIDSSTLLDNDEITTNPLFIPEDSMTFEVLDSNSDEAKSLNRKMSNNSSTTVNNAEIVAEPSVLNSTANATPADFSAQVEDITKSLPKEIFKAYDIRGIVGTTLTTEIIFLIGQAVGTQALAQGQNKMAFARDGRLSGPELGTALVKGLRSTGMNVVDIGMVPTPLLYFVATTATNGTGVMLTGSHNPPNYNGIKMMIAGDTLSGDTIQDLYQRIVKSDFVSGEGGYETATVIDMYLKRVTDDVKLARKFRVVIDCGNGVAGVLAPDLYRKMGCEVIELFCDVDGKFPNHHPDPSQPKNLTHLIEAVKSQKADIGFAFDGDGDRLGVISGDGEIIWPDRLMMLFASDILSREAGAKIIFDVKCTSNLTKHIWEKGGEPLMWKTGHSFIKAKLKESGALLAGEMSGHIFFKERWYGFDDALYTGARLLEILSKDMRKPKVVLAGLPDMVNTPELQLKMAEGEHFEFMEKLYEQADFGSANVLMIDGIRADYEDGWGLVRASNTTPNLIFRFEGKDETALKRIQEQFKTQVLAINSNIKVPF